MTGPYRIHNFTIIFPNGDDYELDPSDATFKNYDIEWIDEDSFYFTSHRQAKKFEEEVVARAQFYYYNRKRFFGW